MKVEAFVKTLEQYRVILANKDKIVLPAANATLAEFVNRIFVNGEDATGSRIGLYSTKAIYVPSPYPQVSNAKLNRRGKTGKKTKKTAYMKGGYKEFRQKAGRQNSKVDLNLTGSMFLNVKLGHTGKSYAIGFVNKLYSERGEGFEKKYGKKIFKLSRNEKKLYRTELIKSLNKFKKQLRI